MSIIEKHKDYISYFHSKPDSGAADAQNQGLKLCTGDLIVFLFADDWFEPDCFKKIAEIFQSEIDIISCGVRHVIKNPEIETLRTYSTKKNLEITLKNMLFGAPNISGKFFSRTFIDKVGGFIVLNKIQEHLFSNDRDFLIKSALLNPTVSYITDICHSYLSHEHSYNFGASNDFIINQFKEHIDIGEQYLTDKSLLPFQKKLFVKWLVVNTLQLNARMFCYKKMLDYKSLRNILTRHFALTCLETFKLCYHYTKKFLRSKISINKFKAFFI